jgi:hypothetical protein
MKADRNFIEIAKNEILRDLMRDRQVHLIRIQLETKFGKLPKWADKRLAETEFKDVPRLAKRCVKASTLEGVLGKK